MEAQFVGAFAAVVAAAVAVALVVEFAFQTMHMETQGEEPAPGTIGEVAGLESAAAWSG